MIIAITGANAFLRRQKQKQLVNEFVANHGNEAVEKIDCEEAELPRILESITAYSLFSTEKLVVLHSPGSHKPFQEDFDKIINQIPETTEVIIIEPKLDRRTAYFKALKKNTDFNDYAEPLAPELAGWLVNFVKSMGGELSSSDTNYLIQRLGPNQQNLAQESTKLCTYQPKITRGSIDLLTEKTPQSTVFELLDAAFAGQVKKALNLYKEQREMRVEPLAMLGMIAWQLNVLAIVKTAGNRSNQEISTQAKLNPFVVQKAKALTNKLPLTSIKKLVADTLSLDLRLKSENIDADEAMNHLLVSIAGN